MSDELQFTNDGLAEFDYCQGDDGGVGEWADLEWVESQFSDKSRWSIWTKVIVHRVSDDTYWAGAYESGATEYQEVDETRKVRFTRVYPKIVTQTIYVKEAPDGT